MNSHVLAMLAALSSILAQVQAQPTAPPKIAPRGPGNNLPANPPVPAPRPILADIAVPVSNGGHWHPSAPPGFKIIDGDILVPLSFNPEVDGFYATNLWPNGTVPYTFDTAFTAAESAQIVTAMNTWSALANVSFVVRTNQNDYVYIQQSTANNSSIGKTGGQQVINFAANQAQRVYIHELGHCLGLFHEHQRPDRGSYISVTQSNVQTSFWSANFPVISNGGSWGPYDFASIMHYDRCAFSTGCAAGSTCGCTSAQETMTALAAYTDWNSVMGNANAQSYLDGVTMRGLYPYGSDRWLDQSSVAPSNGTFQQPYNGSFAAAFNSTPSSGTLHLKRAANHTAIGTFNKAITIVSPAGTATLGN